MGCAASKLDNEEAVRRCKDRRRLMKEAVYARHHLAAAHADYCRSLRLTGSALSSFAAGEPLSVSDQTPAVFLHTPPPPPPPLSEQSPAKFVPPRFPPSPAPPMSPSVASTKQPSVMSASSNRRKKQQPKPKLPHILSESSPSSSVRSERSNFMPSFYPGAFQNSNYSATPSQASSVWNWENFYPPSPPDSEFFNRKAQEKKHNSDNRSIDEDTETERSEYDFFNTRKQKQFESVNSAVEEETETEREEVQCSEWEDHGHYSTTSSEEEEEEEEEDDDRDSISEMGTRSDFGSTVRSNSMRRHHQQPSPMPQGYGGAEQSKFDKADDATISSGSYKGGGEIADMKMVVRHRDLKEIVDAITENFDKAAAAGEQVSQMLELGRAELDRSFSHLKSEFYRSFCFLVLITWN